ncbi:MAG: 4-hydroxy-3-methylbut-2-enyl diphosphate reductase [Bacteroidales bacterium]|nr:4-hydroxy-3-methylbut-2-enyl diphosphate reductase [Bacteroidales bacterium]
MKKIDIDPDAGFCFGVVRAIQQAEEALAQEPSLYCLGDIVHNEEEIERLQQKGLKTINREQFYKEKIPKVLIRAHGEPPEYYDFARTHGITLIDTTCPIVIRLQQEIRRAGEEMNEKSGQVLLFGKKNHAEVIGLNGQINNSAIIIESPQDIENVDYTKPIRLFSQTTKSVEEFQQLSQMILDKTRLCGNDDVVAYNTICHSVSNRSEKLSAFAKGYDVIVFVSGRQSSNGKYLFNICRENNKRTHHISKPEELDASWFRTEDSIGITGATSTPQWLMEKIAVEITKARR